MEAPYAWPIVVSNFVTLRERHEIRHGRPVDRPMRYLAGRAASSLHLRRLTRSRIQRGVRLYQRCRIELLPHCRIEYGAVIDARQDSQVRIGEGAIVCAYTILEGHGGSIELGDDSLINSHCHVFGETLIEEEAIVGPGCVINAHQHSINDPLHRRHSVSKAPVRIGRGAWLGSNVVVMTGIVIGEGAVVGAGAVVTHDVQPHEIAVGIPARALRPRKPG